MRPGWLPLRPDSLPNGPDARPGSPARPKISVVVPTYRRPELLRRCLHALIEQLDLPRSDYEVLVVDDGHTDDTRELVETLAQRTGSLPVLRYLRPASKGPAAARNCGWRAARAPVIAFTDDDTVPDARWLAHGDRAIARGHIAVTGRVIVPTTPRPTDHALNTKGLETAEFVTANVFVLKSALEIVGGFDERFKRAWREDSDLHFSLLERFGDVTRSEDAVVVHPVREAPWGISMSQQANVYFDALLFAKHPQLYRMKVRRRPPWDYFFIVACALAALPAALLGSALGALLPLSAGLLGCLAFAMRRLRRTSLSPAHVTEMLVTSLAIPFLAVFWRLRGAWRFKVLFP
jgi:glycosyltransferase involved in cell wall biosynthesis